jgi:uncharacterized protein
MRDTDPSVDLDAMLRLAASLPAFDPARPGRPIRILSTKYDGSQHYDYRGRLVDEAPGVLRVVTEVGTPFVSYRAESEMRSSMTQLFFTDHWFNVFHNHRPIGRQGMLSYANVGTPVRLEGDTLHWVDLDLDVIQTQERGLYVDDEDEFEEHQRQMAYPDEIIRRAVEAKDHLLHLAREGGFPFDRETHLP